MSFEVIPAVDMKDGKCVQLVQGVPGSEMISLENPVEVALDWVSQGARTLHLIDLDGAIEGNRTNAPIIKKIVEKCKPQGIYIQVGGGIRSFEDAAALLDIGIDKVILSTAALKDPELIKRLSDEFGSEHINVALDSKNGKISIEGWTKESEHTAVEMGSQFEEKGAGSILFTNIDSEGLLNGVDPKPTEDLVNAVTIPVIASGGVTTLEDIVTLKNTGAAGVVVGSALYKKKFTLTEAIDIISDEN
ncbi:1-(5-phosphoribosyl)-5-[(5-phosphoribosylamino)methylideneamino]imidazole-4-carboxamide isomerase [Methanococcoides alaskense]|uniref:1-(5-phosphoribosyl)-5-[(5-phosphoribosylamino)methylideneamino] imidazole-4-carboxamide isomerase n=1 Tax=Methanococcoides alaskense TaxID=325778 RepID=A0AA90TXK0_9EURY|nr:1-(5-phosphoribosyl)-5-[(5-phosphoribosylamino)methylideneamino]imidazole-4-carboxamide isomerase [Methanococcoides alaskense]MDA0525094.1 1-(5-phosphoribosyl)-5-[(5-phosphoribosylamino)methylideneamino]imidazole-4-carboxamide isomerase [Methanococcoides alaskense]MDR6221986.1 phosphoribosylformimino-5-aminoimidazole carboxamide ribotide isomerase [Methanococcoides alaskense]